MSLENLDDFYSPEEEDDEEEEKDAVILPFRRNRTTKVKAGRELVSLFTKADTKEAEHQETDITPELDAEAPVEHLSRVEEVAIGQALAEGMLREVQSEEDEDLSSEYLASISYLEAVMATGDIDEEFKSTAIELGLSQETAEAVSEESMVLPKLPAHETTPAASTPSPEEHEEILADHSEPIPETRQEAKETSGIVNFLMSRRKARIESRASEPVVERDLSDEVSRIRSKLITRERQVRQIVRTQETIHREDHPMTVQEILKKTSRVHETTKKPIEAFEPIQAEIQAQTVTRNELLKLASSIEIGDTKLSAIYENNLLGEKGLRRVVAEFLRGGDIEKVLRTEMVEREIDFERDPVLRDRGDRSTIDNRPQTIDSLLQQSGIDWSEESSPEISSKPKKKPALSNLAKGKSVSSIKTADILLVGFIALLLLTLVVVISSR